MAQRSFQTLFRRLFQRASRGFSPKRIDQAAWGPLEKEEFFARFLTSRSHFSARNKRVKPGAFLPSPRDNATSVFRLKGLAEMDIWPMGLRIVEGLPGRSLHGRADIRVESVEGVGLRLVLDNTPVRHGSITAWPENKDKQLLMALELAAAAILRERPAA